MICEAHGNLPGIYLHNNGFALPNIESCMYCSFDNTSPKLGRCLEWHDDRNESVYYTMLLENSILGLKFTDNKCS